MSLVPLGIFLLKWELKNSIHPSIFFHFTVARSWGEVVQAALIAQYQYQSLMALPVGDRSWKDVPTTLPRAQHQALPPGDGACLCGLSSRRSFEPVT